MELEQRIIAFYRFFNRKITNINVKRDASDSEMNQIRKFICEVSNDLSIHSIGNDWLWRYFAFQFNYWNDLDTGYSRRIQMSWVLGAKAYERWRNKDEDYAFFSDLFCRESGINKSELLKIVESENEKDYDDLFELEEVERGRYFNELEGFAHCLATTSLCHNMSEWCKDCTFKHECQRVLRETNPDLYSKRGYAKRKKIEF